jgi:hypothetical protein
MDYFFSLEHQDLTGHTRALGVLEPGESRTSSAAEVFLGAVDGVKAFFLYPGDLPRKVEKLPVPTIMETRPVLRGNIQLRSSVTTASYQGELPRYKNFRIQT